MFIKCQDSVEKASDDENNAYQEEHGECRVYHPQWPDVSKDQEQPKCTRYCQNQDGAEEDAVAACVGFTLETGDPQIDENFFYSFRDAEGRYYEMGKCECNMELAVVVLDIVLEGIAEAMKDIAPILFVACKLFVGALELAADAAISALPGGAAVTAARRAATTSIKAAKTTYQNGGSEKTFQDLSSAVCPQANFGKLDFGKAFNGLIGVSDEYASGDGCKDKKRSLEARAKGKGDKKDGEKVECRDLPESSKDQPPKDDKDNGLEGVEEKAKKDNDEKNKPKTSSKSPDSTSTTSTTSKPPDSTSTTTSSTSAPTAASCNLCNSPKPKLARRADGPLGYGLMYARAPPDKGKDKNDNEVCARRDKSDDLAAGIDDLTISDGECSGSDLDIRSLDFFSLVGVPGLEKRSTSRKLVAIEWPNGDKNNLDFGTYHPCRDAKRKPDIAKFYKVHHDPNTCSHSVEKVDLRNAYPAQEIYHTEHVYEAQTVKRFFLWLAKGGAVKPGSTFTRPSEIWVKEVLLNLNPNNEFMLKSEDVLGTPKAGDKVFNVMTYGLGRGDGKHFPLSRGFRELTIAEVAINGPKGKLFEGFSLGAENVGKGSATFSDDLLQVRKGPVVFEYLRHRGPTQNDEPIWNKWMRASNWIDLVFHTFDEKYPWGSRAADEPAAPPGEKPSLRALYAYWIDQEELAGMERTVAEWADDVKTKFDKTHPNLKGRAKTWRDEAFVRPGWATESNLKFPRLPAAQLRKGASVYGAYGISDYTRDLNDQTKDVGVPNAIS